MNTIGIQNPKLIVTNDFQQFLVHFDRFLSPFQISDVNPSRAPPQSMSIPEAPNGRVKINLSATITAAILNDS